MGMSQHRRILAPVVALGIVGIALAGCTGGGGDERRRATAVNVSILGGFTDAQAEAFQADLDKWSETSGITVALRRQHRLPDGRRRTRHGGQPARHRDLPAAGRPEEPDRRRCIPLEDLGIDVDAVTADEANGLGDIAVVDGQTFGLPYSINVKSLVWYNPAAFEAAGLTVPTTDEELTAVAGADHRGRHSATRGASALESGGATGWPATDWLEEYVLRYGGLDEYNSWIAGDILFDSDLVNEAGDKVADELLADGKVNGGGAAAATTSFQTAGNQLFVTARTNGQCFMMRQGSFIADFFPDDIKAQIAGRRPVERRLLPAAFPDGTDTAMLGGGDLVGAFTESDDVQAGRGVHHGQGVRHERIRQPGDLPLAAQRLRHVVLHHRVPEEGSGAARGLDAVRIRRFRPDAGRSRRRHRVERADQLVRGSEDDGAGLPDAIDASWPR